MSKSQTSGFYATSGVALHETWDGPMPSEQEVSARLAAYRPYISEFTSAEIRAIRSIQNPGLEISGIPTIVYEPGPIIVPEEDDLGSELGLNA